MPELWAHQKKLFWDISRSIKAGNKWVLAQLMMGGGKTELATHICHAHLKGGVDRKILWLAHRKELIEQAEKTLLDAGLDVSSPIHYNPYKPVQVASTQTLQRRETRPDASLIVTDEAHHYASDTWEPILEYYKSKNTLGLGLSATPARGDNRCLEIYDDLIVGPSPRELVQAGILVKSELIRPERVLDPGTIARDPLEVYLEYCPGTKCIVFAKNVKAATEYAQNFNNRGIAAAIVSAEDDKLTRTRIVNEFKAGRIKVLCNVNIFTEGFNVPDIETCILARSCGTAVIYLQMAGRVLRAAPGKTRGLIIDLYGSSWIHGKPEEDRIYSLTGEAIRRKDKFVNPYKFCAGCQSIMMPGCTICNVCYNTRLGPVPPEILNLPLYKYGWIRRDGDDKRVERLSKWMKDSLDKGHKIGASSFKYNAVYGSKPDKETWRLALKLLDENLNRN